MRLEIPLEGRLRSLFEQEVNPFVKIREDHRAVKAVRRIDEIVEKYEHPRRVVLGDAAHGRRRQ